MPLPHAESLIPQNDGREGGWNTAQELSKWCQEDSVGEAAFTDEQPADGLTRWLKVQFD